MFIDYDYLINRIQIELKNILSYWINYTLDNDNEGFVGVVDKNNIRIVEANKGIILNTRILWTFSAAFNFLKQNEFKNYADRAYEYLIKYFIDNRFGGVFWLLDFKGYPINKRKQIYAQAFAIYALSEYYKSNQNDNVLKHAIDIYYLIEQHAKDSIYGGYIEAFKEDWTQIDDYRLSDKDENLPKSMNTHLHILEAYTNLYTIWQDKKLENNIIDLIEIFIEKIFNHNISHLGLFFTTEWKVMSKIISYGHDIEASWLVYEAAKVVGVKELIEKIGVFSLALAKSVVESIDEYGGLIYEYNTEKNCFNTDKHWWTQAEAMVGFLNAYELSGKDEWLKRFDFLWNFIEKYIIDKQHGEWFWRVNKENNPYDENKVDFWKCPYHNTRACIESIKRLLKIKNYDN